MFVLLRNPATFGSSILHSQFSTTWEFLVYPPTLTCYGFMFNSLCCFHCFSVISSLLFGGYSCTTFHSWPSPCISIWLDWLSSYRWDVLFSSAVFSCCGVLLCLFCTNLAVHIHSNVPVSCWVRSIASAVANTRWYLFHFSWICCRYHTHYGYSTRLFRSDAWMGRIHP